MAEKQMIVLIGCVSGTVTKGESVQKAQIFADVICERPLTYSKKGLTGGRTTDSSVGAAAAEAVDLGPWEEESSVALVLSGLLACLGPFTYDVRKVFAFDPIPPSPYPLFAFHTTYAHKYIYKICR